MLTAMVIVFLVGYLMIALEHPLKINKAGTALLIGTVLWVMYTYAAPFFIPRASAEEFSLFLESYTTEHGRGGGQTRSFSLINSVIEGH